MDNSDSLKLLVRYNRWANQTLWNEVNRLEIQEYLKDVDLFFKSIHGTLNHILLVDKLWFSRFSGGTFKPDGLDDELESNPDNLRQEIDKMSGQWINFIDTLNNDETNQMLNYRNTKGKKRSLKWGPAFLHVFNHGTHHRGQISSALTQLGYEAPEMDIFYYLLDKES